MAVLAGAGHWGLNSGKKIVSGRLPAPLCLVTWTEGGWALGGMKGPRPLEVLVDHLREAGVAPASTS